MAYLTSDACLKGGGAVFNQDWFDINWNIDHPDYAHAHINITELLGDLLEAIHWAKVWSNKCIVVYTDNTNTMFFKNKGSSHSSQAMHFLRILFEYQKNSISF